MFFFGSGRGIQINHHHQQAWVSYDRIAPKGVRHLSWSCACETALTTEPIYVKMMSDHLIEDLPFPLLPRALPKTTRMSLSKFPTSFLVTCPKYPKMHLSHKTLGLTSSLFCWRLKCWFIALSKVSSTSFSRPTFQRHLFFSYCLPSTPMFLQHIGNQGKQVVV